MLRSLKNFFFRSSTSAEPNNDKLSVPPEPAKTDQIEKSEPITVIHLTDSADVTLKEISLKDDKPSEVTSITSKTDALEAVDEIKIQSKVENSPKTPDFDSKISLTPKSEDEGESTISAQTDSQPKKRRAKKKNVKRKRSRHYK